MLVSMSYSTPSALAEITMDPSLYTAAMEGKLEDLKQYPNKRFAFQFTKNNNTVLHVIAEFGHSHCVTEILNACRLLLRRENTHGDTPLHMATAGGHDDVVESLINFVKLPADNQRNEIAPANDGGGQGGTGAAEVREMLKARNRDGDTPLHLAARSTKNNRLGVVSSLTKADRELDYRPNKAGETPLYLVVQLGSDVAVVSEILKNCKSPAYGGPGGKTAMHAAVTDSSKDAILNKVLEWKQDLIKERDAKGRTPLHFAAHNGNLEAVKKLLDKDKSRNKLFYCWEMANSKGRTILHIAADVERDVATNFILKKPWVSRLINRKDNEGNTPLHVLASKGKAGLHMYPGADMLALNNESMTPLDILNRKIARKVGSLDKTSVYMQAQRKDDPDALKTIQAVYMAAMEQRIESLLTQQLTAQFEQLQSRISQYMESRGLEARQAYAYKLLIHFLEVPDAVSGHPTERESIKDDTSLVERNYKRSMGEGVLITWDVAIEIDEEGDEGYCKIARKVGSLDKTSVYMQAQRKDDPDALKTIQAVYMAAMEQRIESLLTQQLTAQFEQLQSRISQYMESRGLEARQVPDAVSGHPTERESIKDDTSLVERSHGPPTNSP
ncbi:hypothetical protein RHSIM_Rhsim04G0192400 [Rhododendron simsii]|uniref:Uncharacterized protein n=1 Tax=Rhododendron simsii TaxID=118357 RepID=A0A834H1C8_RHOSS|nr:hypothetical protein RHSIM_Rhsim04G0192400 [Rhododendron simsii]